VCHLQAPRGRRHLAEHWRTRNINSETARTTHRRTGRAVKFLLAINILRGKGCAVIERTRRHYYYYFARPSAAPNSLYGSANNHIGPAGCMYADDGYRCSGVRPVRPNFGKRPDGLAAENTHNTLFDFRV